MKRRSDWSSRGQQCLQVLAAIRLGNEEDRRDLCGVGQTAKHGLTEKTEAGITMKLQRGSLTVTFVLACVAALELEQVVVLEDI